MKTILLILFAGVISSSSFSQAEQAETVPDALQLIDAWLEAQQAYDHLPGISVGIVKGQELVWSKGYGFSDLKKKTPATPRTLYSICSITKLFTSVAIMQLYEQGKLRLDDSLSTFLPGFGVRQQFSDSGPITIRGLLTHSSGLPREYDFPYWSAPEFKVPTKEALASSLSGQQTLYPASNYFQYSNVGMSLLGQVIEKISGLSYDEYIQENILKPLRLKDTHTNLPRELWGAQLATGYSSMTRQGTREPLPFFDTDGLQAAAGFASTVEDLGRFASWQFRLLKNGGKEILRASTLKEMQRVQWVDPDWKVHWGLGFVVFQNHGKTLIGHFGRCPGYRSILLLDPEEKLACIVLVNAMENPWRYADHLRQIFLKGESERRASSPQVDLQDYVGTYNSQPWESERKVLSWYGNLAVLNLPSENPLEDMSLLKHIEGDKFRRIRRDGELGEEVAFERDEKTGKVVKMWQHSNYTMKVR